MRKLKRLANNRDDIVVVKVPISDEEIKERNNDYDKLEEIEFAKKYRDNLFEEVEFEHNGTVHKIQSNFCTNPFCASYGKSQHRYEDVKYKPSRYKIIGSKYNKSLECNEDPIKNDDGITLGCYTKPLSNWSIAEEIKRLSGTNTVVDWEPEYNFHRDTCINKESNPFDNRNHFRKRGKSSSNSTKYQCKECDKITNILPSQKECYTYHQKKNEILPLFVKLLLNRTPVKRSCEILGISPKTYYHKLEWVYRKCLEFLERHETQNFNDMFFKSIWLNTDRMTYYLNNVRKKGKGGVDYDLAGKLKFPTHIVASADMFSRYVFRADIAYDWDITPEKIQEDIELFKEDKLYNFAKKNAKYRYSSYSKSAKIDSNSIDDDILDLSELRNRENYVDGFHVNSTYTAYAHYWLIKNMINAKRWNFISDKDNSLMSAIFRCFKEEVKNKAANYFLCQIDRNMSMSDSSELYNKAKEALKDFRELYGLKGTLNDMAKLKLESDLEYHSFYDYIEKDRKSYPIFADRPIYHPYPSIDEGIRKLNCATDLSHLSNKELAKILIKVNSRAINSFFQQIHRRISILERPIVTARGEGKSYIYSNFNPKYAQYSLTILRTYLNFCVTSKYKDGPQTPAQKIGLVEKQFDLKDIIYFT